MAITRRQFVAGSGAFLLAGSGGYLAGSLLSPVKPRPNIVFVLADDLRWDAVGFMGNPTVKTPHLDALAKGGIVFRHAFVTTAICPTSRAGILTGQYVMRHGINSFFKHLPPEKMAESFPVLLRSAGYHTGFIGKWGMGWKVPFAKTYTPPAAPLSSYFDRFHYVDGGSYYDSPSLTGGMHLNDYHAQLISHFFSTRPKDRPFMLMFSSKAPHFPFQPQPRFKALYDKTVFPALPSNAWGKSKAYQKVMRNYAGLVSGLDDIVGGIVAALEKDGSLDDTWIFFTSDNGAMMGEHKRHGKGVMYEESIRVPGLLHVPERRRSSMPPGALSDAIVTNIDYAPTILDIAGIIPPAGMQGVSILNPAIRQREDFLYCHPPMYYSSTVCTGVRERRWKYSVYKQKYRQLFDLENDPHEMRNLARDPEHAGQLKRLEGRRKELLAAFGDKKPEIERT